MKNANVPNSKRSEKSAKSYFATLLNKTLAHLNYLQFVDLYVEDIKAKSKYWKRIEQNALWPFSSNR